MMSSLHGSTGRWRRRVGRREGGLRRKAPHLVLRSRGRGRGDQHASRRGWAAEYPLLTLVLSPAAAAATSSLALLPAYPTAVWRTRRGLAGRGTSAVAGVAPSNQRCGRLGGRADAGSYGRPQLRVLGAVAGAGGTALFVLEPILAHRRGGRVPPSLRGGCGRWQLSLRSPWPSTVATWGRV